MAIPVSYFAVVVMLSGEKGLEYYLKNPKNLWLVRVDAHN